MKITDDMLTEWRKQFEAEFPMPPDCIWTGKGYAATSYNAWEARTFIARFEGWLAARRTTPDREAWISVAERLPESPGDYLLFRPAAHLPPASDPNITIREFFGRGKVGGDRFGGAHAVTHWMPLPAAPTSDQGGA
ncbi:DUF551 domain-containing protein [Burkholderia multivorans]|uniref:DUF551 domain-containing protein n=1 Tax=Burkholderia multivorans TaxID=87883 RepID=UPI0020B2C26A|nr:DUF551 domain-containing protein [Burkholderia multivorans]